MNSRLVAIIVGAFLGLASLAGTAWWFARDVAPQPLYAAYTIVAPTSVAESQVVARALIRA